MADPRRFLERPGAGVWTALWRRQRRCVPAVSTCCQPCDRFLSDRGVCFRRESTRQSASSEGLREGAVLRRHARDYGYVVTRALSNRSLILWSAVLGAFIGV